MATELPIWIPAVSTAARPSLSDCKQAASLLEIWGVNFHQSDFRWQSELREATRKLKPNNQPALAQITGFGKTQGAFTARQFCPSGYTVSWAKPGSLICFYNLGAKLVTKELYWCFCLQPILDLFIGQLCFSDRIAHTRFRLSYALHVEVGQEFHPTACC